MSAWSMRWRGRDHRRGHVSISGAVTFALGTAAGDYLSESLAIGYWKSALLFGAAHILTRPLGASIGDYLSQPTEDGGLGWGTTTTSLVFLATILAVTTFLSITKRDMTPGSGDSDEPRLRGRDARSPASENA